MRTLEKLRGGLVESGAASALFGYGIYLLVLTVAPYWLSYTISAVASALLVWAVHRFKAYRTLGDLVGPIFTTRTYVLRWAIGLLIVRLWIRTFGLPAVWAPLVAAAIVIPVASLWGTRFIERFQTLAPAARTSASRARSNVAATVLTATAALAVLLGFSYIGYGYVFSNGLCCADDSSIAVAAKNLALGYGYTTSVPYLGGGGMRAFDPLLSTGPTLVLPAAAIIKLFGPSPWAPGLATAIVTTLLLALIGVVIARHVSRVRALGYLAAMVAVQYTTTAGARFVQWYSLLGEVPAAMLTVLGAALLAWGGGRRRSLVTSFLAFGLAVMAKTLALLGVVPAVVWLLWLLVRRSGLRTRNWTDIAIAATSFSLPIIAFECWKLSTLGMTGYVANLRDFRHFLTSTGGNVSPDGAGAVLAKIANNATVMRDNFGFGLFELVLVVIIAVCVVNLSAERNSKVFAGLVVGSGTMHLVWFMCASVGNPRYALIGILLLAAGVSCVIFSRPATPAALATIVVILLAAAPAYARLWGPVAFAQDGGFRPNERVANLHATTDYLTKLGRDQPFVGGWWATVVDLEYMLPKVENFENVDDVDPADMRRGRILVRNEFFAGLAPAPLFTEWEKVCSEVLFTAPPYLVTRCPDDRQVQ
ncbi:hypothetical protein [Cellulomonas sp. WB94]|uniref:ArnT family glycosyltransferase n=1 Tax=Cellulomonas sp. WB94 TaxID=2173174 RepID=UPI0011B27EF5|nr:hypothetical protein [Cellulomonas sp. WB94]